MGQFGFSYIGVVYLAMLFIPNSLWAKRQPKGYTPQGENKVLVWFERLGQACVTCVVLVFSNFNLAAVGAWNLWFVLSLALMLLYEAGWVRYFKNPSLQTMYGPFCGVPVPLASLPVTAFFLLGVYGKVVWLPLAAIILGIGHIGIHLQHRRQAGIQ